jgi:hypothetical protein
VKPDEGSAISVQTNDCPAGASAAALSGLSWKVAAADGGADLIIVGGAIVTVNKARPSTEAVAVKDRKIVAVGLASAVRANGLDPIRA